MRGGKNKQPRRSGYTIIETLIFLAVSGTTFLIAAAFISGKQANAEFKQAMNDAESQIQRTINDVANGYYPSNQNFSCEVNGASASPTFTSTSSKELGTNRDCIFMGKVMQFGTSGSNGRGYRIYSVAGRRFVSGDAQSPPTTFAQARPTAISTGTVNVTDEKNLQWGLRTYGMYRLTYAPNGTFTSTAIGSLGIFGNFGNVSGGVLQSGAQSVIMAQVPGALNQDNSTTITNISNITTAHSPNMAVLICLTDDRGHNGSVTVGGRSGQQLHTVVKMGSVTAPC